MNRLVLAVLCAVGGSVAWADDAPICAKGLAPTVLQKCGCHPLAQNLEHRVAVLKVTDSQLLEVTNCINANANASVVDKKVFDGKLEGCLKHQKKLDEKTRDEFLKVLSSVADQVKEEAVDWRACYQDATGTAHKDVVRVSTSAPPAPADRCAGHSICTCDQHSACEGSCNGDKGCLDGCHGKLHACAQAGCFRGDDGCLH